MFIQKEVRLANLHWNKDLRNRKIMISILLETVYKILHTARELCIVLLPQFMYY